MFLVASLAAAASKSLCFEEAGGGGGEIGEPMSEWKSTERERGRREGDLGLWATRFPACPFSPLDQPHPPPGKKAMSSPISLAFLQRGEREGEFQVGKLSLKLQTQPSEDRLGRSLPLPRCSPGPRHGGWRGAGRGEPPPPAKPARAHWVGNFSREGAGTKETSPPHLHRGLPGANPRPPPCRGLFCLETGA